MLQDHPADDEVEGKLRIAGGLQGNVANLVARFHRLVGGMRRGLDPLHLPAGARHPVEEVAGRTAEFQQPPGRSSRRQRIRIHPEIGSESWRERVGQYVSSTGVAATTKKKH